MTRFGEGSPRGANADLVVRATTARYMRFLSCEPHLVARKARDTRVMQLHRSERAVSRATRPFEVNDATAHGVTDRDEQQPDVPRELSEEKS